MHCVVNHRGIGLQELVLYGYIKKKYSFIFLTLNIKYIKKHCHLQCLFMI